MDDIPHLEYDFSRLTTHARWTDKAECFEIFDGSVHIQKYILSWQRVDPVQAWLFENSVEREWNTEHGSAELWDWWDTGDAEIEDSALQSEIGTDVRAGVADIRHQWWSYIKTWWYILLGIVVLICLFKFGKYIFEYIYDVIHSKRMVYLKILLPRWDSKSDRDVQKELAKDMKEKIWRMSQVYRALHKLGALSARDNVLKRIFDKPKLVLLYQYDKWLLFLVVGTYPEYKKIVESALSAQYSSVSLTEVSRPRYFTKKYSQLIPLQSVKSSYYPIRTFKQLEDDPINNIFDSLSKVNVEDTFTIQMVIKPEWEWFNKNAQKMAEALYKKDEAVLKGTPLRKKILPRNFFGFLIHGPSEALIQKFSWDKKSWDPMVRMVKAEEEALNIMGEEAGKQAFESSLVLISSSDYKDRAQDNLYNIVSAYSVYKDEYNNELDQPERLADLFGIFVDPMWRFGARFHLTWFFSHKHIFTVNELASLYHLPDATYNRQPTLKRMDYKVVSAPDNLVKLKEENPWFVISGILAEEYKKWKISDILSTMKHRDVTYYDQDIIDKELLDDDYVVQEWDEIEEIDEKKFKITRTKDQRYGFKTYTDGILLWVSVYRNVYRPVYMKRDDRTRHHYIVGKSGTGKSVYISALARQDVWAGDGVCVIDPHGDLVEEILEYIPKSRAKDVIYFDAGNEERPMGLNLYQISHVSQADRAVNDAVEMFVKMFGPEIFGPRIQEYFKYGSLTLLEDMEEWATLIDVPRLFTDEVYREYKTKRAKNPVVRNFRDKTYNAMGDREKQEIIPYFTSKFVSFITNSLIRNIIWQTKSAFEFDEVMNTQKILLINLSKGKIWQMNAQLLGMIIVSKIYNGAMARQSIAKKDRKDFYLYVDEFQNFVTDTFADILSEARKYRLNLIMAHQFIAQLDGTGAEKSQVKDAVFGNVGTMQSFKVGAPDAEFLEKEYQPTLSAQDILGIANYKAYIKLNINNTTTRPFSMDSIYTTEYRSKKIWKILKKYSEKKYGRKKEFVDAEITARLGIIDDSQEQGEEEKEE